MRSAASQIAWGCAEALVIRVSETDYLVAQPDISRFAGQVNCLAALREILTFFLGEARPEDLFLREVTTLSQGGVTSHKVDAPRGVQNDFPDETVAPPSSLPPAETASQQASPDKWSPFATSDGRALRVSCLLEPVFEMQKVRLVGHRLEPVVTRVLEGGLPWTPGRAINALSPVDRERVDLATIARGVSRIRSTAVGARSPMIMLPAAFTTLGSSRGRAALVNAMTEAKVDAWMRVVCEIDELDGAPTSRLIEAVSLIKPFCYAILGRTGGNRRTMDAIATAGFNGASRLFDPAAPDEILFERLQWFAESARERMKVCMSFGLTRRQGVALASAAGVSHTAIGAPTLTDGEYPLQGLVLRGGDMNVRGFVAPVFHGVTHNVLEQLHQLRPVGDYLGQGVVGDRTAAFPDGAMQIQERLFQRILG